MSEYRQYLELAQSIAREAGEIMRGYFGNNPESELKADRTIVTVADKEINSMVIDRVREAYPEHSIDGEEQSRKNGSAYVWACDPIDGTAMFAKVLPVSVFSLALCVDGVPVVGVVYAPFSEMLYSAEKGQGAFMNNQPIRVNQKGFDPTTEVNVDWWPAAPWDAMSAMHDLACNKGALLLSIGSATHASVLVARGEFAANVFVGTQGKHVDIAAAKVIVEEAGGKVTDIFGEEQRYDQDIRGAILSNGIIHDEIVSEMKRRYA